MKGVKITNDNNLHEANGFHPFFLIDARILELVMEVCIYCHSQNINTEKGIKFGFDTVHVYDLVT